MNRFLWLELAQASPTTVPAPGVQSLARALSGQSVSLARALALTIYLYTHAFIRTTIHTVASLASPRTARIASHASPRKPSQRLSTPNAARLASLASPRLPSHHIAASPHLACNASLASHRSTSHRIARLASIAIGSALLACLASPCSPRLHARLASLALPRLSRSPCLASLALPRSPRLSLARASPPRSPSSFGVPASSPRPLRRLPPAASLPPMCRLQNLRLGSSQPSSFPSLPSLAFRPSCPQMPAFEGNGRKSSVTRHARESDRRLSFPVAWLHRL